MEGDEQGGFSVFWADDGLDTGPILLQKSVDIDPNETVDSLYNRFLYPEGIKSMVCGFIISKINLKRGQDILGDKLQRCDVGMLMQVMAKIYLVLPEGFL